MIRLIGPSVSTEASGKLANALIFSTSKKGPYVKAHAVPTNPMTPKQLSTRAMMKWLSQEWKNLSTAEKDTWLKLAAACNLAPYHVYVAQNQIRWKSFLMPSKEYPATEAKWAPQVTNAWAVGGKAMATYNVHDQLNKPDWGWCLTRSTVLPFPTDREHVVALFQANPTGISTYVDTPLNPGTYYYRNFGFHGDGKKGLPWGIATAIVT